MTGKTKIVLFHMNGCGPCRRFMEGTLTQFQNSGELNKYELIKHESSEPVTREVGVRYFPSLSIVPHSRILRPDEPITVEMLKSGLVKTFDSRATVDDLKKMIEDAEKQTGGADNQVNSVNDLPSVVGKKTEEILRKVLLVGEAGIKAGMNALNNESELPAVQHTEVEPKKDAESDSELLPTNVVHTEAEPKKDAESDSELLPTNVVHTEAEAEPESKQKEGESDDELLPTDVVHTEVANEPKQVGAGCGMTDDEKYKQKYLKYKLKYEQLMKKIF